MYKLITIHHTLTIEHYVCFFIFQKNTQEKINLQFRRPGAKGGPKHM